MIRFIRRNLGLLAVSLVILVVGTLYVVDLIRNAPDPIPPVSGVVAYRSDETGSMEIYVTDLQERKPTRLTINEVEESGPAWNVLANLLAVTQVQGNQSDIAIINAINGNARVVTSDPAREYQPVWSPDGRTIVFVREINGVPTLHRLDSQNTSTVELLFEFEGGASEPAYSPDGALLLFTSEREGVRNIYQYEVETGAISQLTTGPGNSYQPALSPNGARLAFISDRDGTPSIYVQNLRNGNVERLTEGGIDANPRWSHSGDRILFDSVREGNHDIYLVVVRNGELLRVTEAPGIEDQAAWQPPIPDEE